MLGLDVLDVLDCNVQPGVFIGGEVDVLESPLDEVVVGDSFVPGGGTLDVVFVDFDGVIFDEGNTNLVIEGEGVVVGYLFAEFF